MTKGVKQTFKETGQLDNPSETFDKDGNLTFSDQGRPYRDENGVLTTTTYCEGEIIEPKIRTVIDQNLIFDYSHILHSLQPYHLHTDYSQNDMIINDRIKPAYTIIIPLGNFDSNTFVFNQHDEDKNLKNLDRSTVLKDCVDSKTREDHLSLVNQKELDYVSIKEKFTWTKGSLHACDRRYIHCSDNYYKNKEQLYKNAIVFWTSIRI